LPARVPNTEDPKAIETTVDHEATPPESGIGDSHPWRPVIDHAILSVEATARHDVCVSGALDAPWPRQETSVLRRFRSRGSAECV
jgi:hypothetical protein